LGTPLLPHRTICTSVALRPSTRVSSGFTLCTHSSLSFRSQQMSSYSNLSKKYPDRSMVPFLFPKEKRISHLSQTNWPSLSLRIMVCHHNTRTHVRLLGPCFKTGRLKPYVNIRSACFHDVVFIHQINQKFLSINLDQQRAAGSTSSSTPRSFSWYLHRVITQRAEAPLSPSL